MIVHVGQVVEDDRLGRVEEAPLALSEGRVFGRGMDHAGDDQRRGDGGVAGGHTLRPQGVLQAQLIQGVQREALAADGADPRVLQGVEVHGDGLLGRGVEAPQAQRLHESERGVAAAVAAGAAQHVSAYCTILWHYKAPGQPGRPGFIGLSRRKPLKSAEASTKVTKSGYLAWVDVQKGFELCDPLIQQLSAVH